jgi:hypothetical protein
MSYTEYLRRKAAAAPVVLSTRSKLDASSYTNRVRLAAAGVDFSPNGQKYGSITNVFDPDSGGTAGQFIHAIGSYKKVAGGRVPDASAFTAYSGGQAIGKEIAAGMPSDRILMNSNDTGSISGCLPIPAPVAPKNASSFTKDIISCHEVQGEKHNTDATTHPGPSVFVDNTISQVKNYNLPQNKTEYQISQKCTSCGNNPPGTGVTCVFCVGANHTPSADMPHNTRWAPRPAKSAQPIIVVSSPSDARKVGDFNPRRPPRVFANRGNPNIGHIRYPKTPYQIPAGTAAHLKINEPVHYPGTM